jgi:hypothetical protein
MSLKVDSFSGSLGLHHHAPQGRKKNLNPQPTRYVIKKDDIIDRSHLASSHSYHLATRQKAGLT